VDAADEFGSPHRRVSTGSGAVAPGGLAVSSGDTRGNGMAATGFLFEALKAHLKSRSITYATLAIGLGISESTVKRIFSQRRCSTGQLDAICDFIQVDLADLVRTAPRSTRLLDALTWTQEEEIMGDPKLFVVAVCALHQLNVEQIVGYYRLTEPECVQKLLRLERIGFLELHPGNRFRLLVSRTFRWIPDGPIARYAKSEMPDYFDHAFDQPGELLHLLNVRISPASRLALLTRLHQLAETYNEQHIADSALPIDERQTLSICLAARSWEPHLFKALRRRRPAQPEVAQDRERSASSAGQRV
jgi:DNA-binding Xre family transcriptional regulator